jgi:hypothetical protein
LSIGLPQKPKADKRRVNAERQRRFHERRREELLQLRKAMGLA